MANVLLDGIGWPPEIVCHVAAVEDVAVNTCPEDGAVAAATPTIVVALCSAEAIVGTVLHDAALVPEVRMQTTVIVVCVGNTAMVLAPDDCTVTAPVELLVMV